VADLTEERQRRSESGGSSRQEAEEVRVVADLSRRGGVEVRVERIWRGAGETEDGSREETRRRPDGRPGGEWRGLGLPHPAPAPSPLYMAGRLGLAGYVGFVLAGRPTCRVGPAAKRARLCSPSFIATSLALLRPPTSIPCAPARPLA
jgi:hypothetical protein